MLHLIFRSQNLSACIDRVSEGDAVVFFEHATFCLMKGHTLQTHIHNVLQKNVVLCVLQDEVDARGLQSLIDGVQRIDYAGFVKLTEQYPVCKTWS